MNAKDIFQLAISLGKAADPRGLSGVDKRLKKINSAYEQLPDNEKAIFDQDKLTNPYLDSGIHYDSDKEVKKILAGIDISSAELLLAKELGVDLVISHHPEGKGLAMLNEVMELQADLLSATAGVPINVGEGILKKRSAKVKRSILPLNHFQAVDTAKLLNISFMSVHTPADNLVWYYLEQAIKDQNPEYIEDIIDLLNKIPEYAEGRKNGIGPMIFCGDKNNRTGKISCTEITGGTSNDKAIYEKIALSGLGTIIGMHMDEMSLEEAEKNYLNVIIAGHMSSDSLGMNIFLDEIESHGITIIPCSGLIRIKRK